HLVGRDTVHAGARQARAAKQIAAAHHDADLYTEGLHIADFLGDAFEYRWIDAVIGLAEQRLARELHEHAAKGCVRAVVHRLAPRAVCHKQRAAAHRDTTRRICASRRRVTRASRDSASRRRLAPALSVLSGSARTVRIATAAGLGGLGGGAHLRHDVGDEVVLLLLDAGTDLVALETRHTHTGRLEQLLDRLLRLLHEGLPEQHDLVERLAQTTLDHLGDDLGALALFLRLLLCLLGEDLALLGHDVGGHVAGRDEARVAGSDVHRHVVRQRFQGIARLAAGGALERYQHSDARAMHVGADDRFGASGALQYRAAAHTDVLPDLGHQRATVLIDALARGEFGLEQGLEIHGAMLERQTRHVGGEAAEVLFAGDEIGLAVD